MQGISIIICCYNSARVLPETLTAISKQHVPAFISWELIVVDNASTDQTSTVAKEVWATLNCPVSFNVIPEPLAGLSHARSAGMRAAAFEYVLFCDDDNLLQPDYLQRGYQVLNNNPSIAMLGGKGIPKLSVVPPAWFERYAYQYALGEQGAYSKDITIERGYVYGAGCFLRMSAYSELLQKGFEFTLSDRKGESLVSGGDNELCYALSLLGYSIYYEETLLFEHVLSPNRLTLAYLKKLKRAVAYSSTVLIPYVEKRRERLEGKPVTFHWSKKMIAECMYVVNGYVKYPFASSDFKIDILLDRQSRFGKIKSLIINRKLLRNKENWLPWLK